MIYRLIFRLDYPMSYKLLDSLGKITDFVQTAFDQLDAKQKKVDLEILNRKIDAGCLDKNDNGLRFVVELQSIHGSFDFKNGISISEVQSFFGVKFIHEMIGQLGLDSLKYFSKFGIRCLYLAENPKFSFDAINNYILHQEKILSRSFESCNFRQDDSMVTIVGEKEIYGLRIAYGPYAAAEALRHFMIAPEVKEALMIDIDLSSSKIEAQKIDFISKLDLYLKEIDNLAVSIQSNLESVINV